jgi:ATP-dependent protease HslVU (ClpYQ) peptidase subunit
VKCASAVKRIKEAKQGIKMEKREKQRRVRGNDGNTNVPNTVIKKTVRKERKIEGGRKELNRKGTEAKEGRKTKQKLWITKENRVKRENLEINQNNWKKNENVAGRKER